MWAGKRVGSHEKRSVWGEKGAGKQASRKWGIGAGRGGKKKDKRKSYQVVCPPWLTSKSWTRWETEEVRSRISSEERLSHSS